MFVSCRKSQRACEKLDLQESIETPAVVWFWPIRKKPDAEEPDSDDDNTPEETPTENTENTETTEEGLVNDEDEEEEIEFEVEPVYSPELSKREINTNLYFSHPKNWKC